jgi:hypothetical protein
VGVGDDHCESKQVKQSRLIVFYSSTVGNSTSSFSSLDSCTTWSSWLFSSLDPCLSMSLTNSALLGAGA